jgi:glycosyltransferase involved in cell wall biosynthesis
LKAGVGRNCEPAGPSALLYRPEPATRKSLRVLMTLDAVGGVWRYAMDLGSALAARGIAIIFAGLGLKASQSQIEEARQIGELVWLDAPLDWTADSPSELDVIPELLSRLVEEWRIDLVHLNLPSQAFGLALPVPVVVVSHSCVVSWFRAVRNAEVPPDWQWQKRRNRAGFDAAGAVIAPSRSHADLLLACYGPIDNLKVIHNAVESDFPAIPKEPLVLAAGRWWDDGKNGRALDSAAALCSWPICMAGATDGPNGQSITLHHARPQGELPNTDLRAIMSRAGIVVSPSIFEPFGLAVLEAARARAALVLSDIPTFRELWDGAAMFADPHDAPAFAAAINRFAADADLRVEFGHRAQLRAQRFSLASQATAVIDVYDAVLARTGRPFRAWG